MLNLKFINAIRKDKVLNKPMKFVKYKGKQQKKVKLQFHIDEKKYFDTF